LQKYVLLLYTDSSLLSFHTAHLAPNHKDSDIRERSNIIWRLRRGFAQPGRVPYYGGRGVGQIVI